MNKVLGADFIKLSVPEDEFSKFLVVIPAKEIKITIINWLHLSFLNIREFASIIRMVFQFMKTIITIEQTKELTFRVILEFNV